MSAYLHDNSHVAQLDNIPVFALLCLSVRVCMCVVPCVRCMRAAMGSILVLCVSKVSISKTRQGATG